MNFDEYTDGRYGKTLDRSIDYCPLPHDFFTRAKADHLERVVRAHFGSDAKPRLLDLGCGEGLTDAVLKHRFSDLQGLDVSAGLLDAARERNPELTYHHYDGTRSDLPDGSFDVVFAICVWHHVPVVGWEAFAAESARLLKPGGMFLVYEHNPYNPLTRLSVARCEFDSDAVLLRPVQVRRLMTGAGLRETATDFILFFPFDKPWCRRFEERLLRAVPFGAQFLVRGTKPAAVSETPAGSP